MTPIICSRRENAPAYLGSSAAIQVIGQLGGGEMFHCDPFLCG
jgi:hypothetical protein